MLRSDHLLVQICEECSRQNSPWVVTNGLSDFLNDDPDWRDVVCSVYEEELDKYNYVPLWLECYIIGYYDNSSEHLMLFEELAQEELASEGFAEAWSVNLNSFSLNNENEVNFDPFWDEATNLVQMGWAEAWPINFPDEINLLSDYNEVKINKLSAYRECFYLNWDERFTIAESLGFRQAISLECRDKAFSEF